MFDLTDDAENSPETTLKEKPAEVKTITKKVKIEYKNDEFNIYEINETDDEDDKNW